MEKHFILSLLFVNICAIYGNHAEYPATHTLFKRQIHRNRMRYQRPYTMQRINDPYLGNVDIHVIEVDQFGNPIVPYQRPNVAPVQTNVYPQTYNRGGNQYEIKVLNVDEQGNVYQEMPGSGVQYVGNIYRQNQPSNPNNIPPNNNYPNSNQRPVIMEPTPTNTNTNIGNNKPQTEAPRTINIGPSANSHNYPSLDELISKSDGLVHVPPKNQQKQQEEVPTNTNTNVNTNVNTNPVPEKKKPQTEATPVQKPQTEATPVQPNKDAPFIFDSVTDDDEKPKTSEPTENLDVLKNREDVLQHTPTFGNPDAATNRQSRMSELYLNDGEIRK